MRQLGPVCDELNALLRTVQSPGRPHANELHPATTREEATIRYGRAPTVLVAIAAAHWVLSGIIVALVPKPVVAVFLGVLALLDSAQTYLRLRLAKKNIDRLSPAPAGLPSFAIPVWRSSVTLIPASGRVRRRVGLPSGLWR